MQKRKILKKNSRTMERPPSFDSNISLDSLELDFKKKTSIKNRPSEDNVDTILVPFYEKDVLVKVSKGQKKKQKQVTNNKYDQINKETLCTSYLVNKDKQKARRISYLEMFRKQVYPQQEKKMDRNEIRSLSPEFGDTERESIGDDANNPVMEFYDTECYNEIYYENLLNQDLVQYLDTSLEEGLQLTDHLRSKSLDNNNLKSISQVSQQHRHVRRATVLPIDNVKLGGLGPDMEKIKPRLERARCLQRYSERVRMENRLRIYKKSVQDDNDKKAEKVSSARRSSANTISNEAKQNASYLVNKAPKSKNSNAIVNLYCMKSKSADVQRNKEINIVKTPSRDKSASKKNESVQQVQQARLKKIEKENKKEKINCDTQVKVKCQKSNARSKTMNAGDEVASPDVAPVHISFLVNVGGVRPSTALKKLEEKHRMYQEQIKAFKMENNNPELFG